MQIESAAEQRPAFGIVFVSLFVIGEIGAADKVWFTPVPAIFREGPCKAVWRRCKRMISDEYCFSS